jgi:hypothetical protein
MYLCSTCVSKDAHLFFCDHCGAYAQRIATESSEPSTVKEVLKSSPAIISHIAATITNHIIVPAAIIIMVGAFLFFLLEVRSVFLSGSASLKRIGFCFGAATVLIARYGKVHAIKKRQTLYTAILGIATLRAMMIYSTGGMLNILLNILVIAAVWRFATGVTNSLDTEQDEEIETGERKLYGVERLEHEEMEKQYNLNASRFAARRKAEALDRQKKKGFFQRWFSGADAHGNPARSVARLAMLAIVTFALGEPVILAGPPEVGPRALMAVIVFLLSTGVVLAAASAMGTYRHTRKAHGEASTGMIPIKIFAALLLTVVVLGTGLAVPGLNYEGSGKLSPQKTIGSGSVRGDNQDNRSQSTDKDTKTDKDIQSDQRGRSKERTSSESDSPADSGSIFESFAALGKLLLLPLALAFIALVIYALVKLWPSLKGMRAGIMDRLRKLLERLRGLMKRKKSAAVDSGTSKHIDPLELLRDIPTMQPREAILASYHCFLGFIEQLGYRRQPRLTPYEFLRSLPERLNYLHEPARQLTDLYVGTAYGNKAPSDNDCKKALNEISRLRHLIDSQQTVSR